MGKDAENYEGTIIDYSMNQLDIILYLVTTDNKKDAILYINSLYKELEEFKEDSCMYNENQFDFTEDDYVDLYDKYMDAQTVCAPDEYQKKQNDLCKHMANFLLKPYMNHVQNSRDFDDD